MLFDKKDRIIYTRGNRYFIEDMESGITASGETLEEATLRLSIALKASKKRETFSVTA